MTDPLPIGYDCPMRLGAFPSSRPASRAPRTRSRAGASLLALGLLLGATACSGDESSSSEPEGSSASASTGAEAEPGPEVEAETATFEAPGGFVVAEGSKKSDAILATGPAGNLVSVVELDFPGDAPSLERQAEITLMGLGEKFEVQDPVEVDGVEMYHLSGKESKGRFADVYGAVVDGTAVRLTLRLSAEEYDADQRAAVNQQVLDSWTWDA